MEEFHPYELPEGYDTSKLVMPVLEYGHDLGCSITGGYVYRGKKYPALQGTYFFSDFCSGRIWGLRRKGDRPGSGMPSTPTEVSDDWEWAEFLDTRLDVSSFGVDEEGEIYVLDYNGGTVFHLK